MGGSGLEPEPFEPVLRGQLLTGGTPRYLSADLTGGQGDTSKVEFQPLWWPPSKIAGAHLAPFLTQLGVGELPALRTRAASAWKSTSRSGCQRSTARRTASAKSFER